MTTTIIEATHDVASLTMTFTAEFDAVPERVWQIWEDPRRLERWWGPPTWPATFTRHEPVPGGRSDYVMTGPDGTRSGGWWTTTAAEPPHRLAFEDGFSTEDGEPDLSMPVSTTEVVLAAVGGGTRMTIITRFPSEEALEQLLAMGMEEGMRAALGQIAGLLAD